MDFTWLVTGATGFVGSAVYWALACEATRREPLIGLARRRPFRHDAGRFVELDLATCDARQLARELAPAGPLVVIHAAGATPPGGAARMYRANTRATACLVDALNLLPGPHRLVLAGSAAELGPVPAEWNPVSESTPCRPLDSYGLSKWCATRLALAANRPGRLEVVVGRLFNPIGRGLPATQVFGRVAGQLARIATDQRFELCLGRLDATRDFFDVHDAAEALITLGREGRSGGLYHVGSGVAHSVGQGVGHLVRLSGRGGQFRTGSGHARGGPSVSCADIRRIVAETSWRPRVRFETSLDELWQHVEEQQAASDPKRSVA